jgi:hypothetical protein
MTPKDELTFATTTPVTHTIVVNDLPSASFSISPNPATVGVPVAFNGLASSDPDGSITNYAWSFGDGANNSGATPSHVYGAPGIYTATLTVTDSAGLTSATSHQVTVAPTSLQHALISTSSNFSTLSATFNQRTGAITFTESVGDSGTFSLLLTFQNGKFGVFAARKSRCNTGFVRPNGKCYPSKIVYAKGSKLVAAPGAVRFTIKPSASGLKALRDALKRKKGLPVTATLTFQPSHGGSPISHTQSLSVKLKKSK